MDREVINTKCCIVGGGPAGMMLGYLLARAGIEVVVLEKHKDFFRDFRGDTIHPSTMELMQELGILDDFLQVPHNEAAELMLSFEGTAVMGPDFSHLPVTCKYIAFMPQWDFLNFIAEKAKKYPGFSLRMGAEAIGLIEKDGRITGVIAKSDEGDIEVRAAVTFGTDGRHSVVRERAGLVAEEFGVPIDVLWFRLDKPEGGDTRLFLGRVSNGQMMITLDRGDYFQCGLIIPKGAFEAIKGEGLAAFQERIAGIVPALRGPAKALDKWDKVKLLTVQINRLRNWSRPGLLCIGDAAHAMSPAGGVGINLAVQDAVAAANLLYDPLRRGHCTAEDLQRVQARREWPVKMTQAIQIFMHRNMFRKGRDPSRAVAFPWIVRKFFALFAPVIRRAGARIVGIGFRAEHIESPEAKP
ncbi:MAG TPA: FAD-dependent oxidoreductase [Chthoniobacteraceae bacterium]|nr:FAD-dependent oxidoreductase [Chthoniobacteraceae bacterium]